MLFYELKIDQGPGLSEKRDGMLVQPMAVFGVYAGNCCNDVKYKF